MENSNEKKGFSYTYSAKEQTEIRKIREKYTAPTEAPETNLERLRRLDAKVTEKATVVSLILGILGTLILGLGMSLVMTDLGNLLGSYADKSVLLGVVIGIVGCIPVALAYPTYQWIVKRERSKIAPEILRLTDELMK